MDQATEELLSRYLDGDLDDKEIKAFEGRLEYEPELQDALDGMGSLKEAVANIAVSMDPPNALDALMEPLRRSRPKPRGLRHAYGLLAAAATVVIGVGIAFELQRRHPQPVVKYENHGHVVSKSEKDGYFQLQALPTAVPGEEALLGATDHLLAEPGPESPEAEEPPALVVIGPLTEEERVADRGGNAVEDLTFKGPSSDFAPDPGTMTARAPKARMTLSRESDSIEIVTLLDGREIHRTSSFSAQEGHYSLMLNVKGGLIVECTHATDRDSLFAASFCSQIIGTHIGAQPDGSVEAEVLVTGE